MTQVPARTDKIVIVDRVRENLRKYRKMEIVPLLNLSINETLARTVMTSLTLILSLAALVALGPDVIFGFSLAMLLGIVIGVGAVIAMVTLGNGASSKVQEMICSPVVVMITRWR
mgnify:CR=1 FL=1